MITFDEYYEFLEKQASLRDYYNYQFRQLAENSKYLRSDKVTKKYQKEIEKKRVISFNVLNNIFKDEMKNKGVKAVITKNEEESKFKLFFKKLFRIKPKVVEGVIEEFSSTATPPEEPENKVIEGESTECYFDEEYEEEFQEEDFDDDEDPYFNSNDIIEGQMDIDDLNEGEIDEKA